MKRVIVTPAILPPAALAELKEWLGITTAQDDAPLAALLRAATEMCEDFTQALPLASTCEETLAPDGEWQALRTRPVQAITGVDALASNGVRGPLPAEAYDVELDAHGCGWVRVRRLQPAGRIVVRFTAGVAPDWASLPEALRHGIVRLAAHQHRQRDSDGKEPSPPAAVAALWRPWRRMRLS